jgi:hypothetical protein
MSWNEFYLEIWNNLLVFKIEFNHIIIQTNFSNDKKAICTSPSFMNNKLRPISNL